MLCSLRHASASSFISPRMSNHLTFRNAFTHLSASSRTAVSVSTLRPLSSLRHVACSKKVMLKKEEQTLTLSTFVRGWHQISHAHSDLWSRKQATIKCRQVHVRYFSSGLGQSYKKHIWWKRARTTCIVMVVGGGTIYILYKASGVLAILGACGLAIWGGRRLFARMGDGTRSTARKNSFLADLQNGHVQGAEGKPGASDMLMLGFMALAAKLLPKMAEMLESNLERMATIQERATEVLKESTAVRAHLGSDIKVATELPLRVGEYEESNSGFRMGKVLYGVEGDMGAGFVVCEFLITKEIEDLDIDEHEVNVIISKLSVKLPESGLEIDVDIPEHMTEAGHKHKSQSSFQTNRSQDSSNVQDAEWEDISPKKK